MDPLVEDLERYGISVWYDTLAMRGGDNLIERISDALDECDFCIAVLSVNSVDSKWVRFELRTAMYLELDESQIRVIPVVIGRLERRRLPRYLREKLAISFPRLKGTQYEESFLDLLTVIAEKGRSSNGFSLAPHLIRDVPEPQIRVLRSLANIGGVGSAIDMAVLPSMFGDVPADLVELVDKAEQLAVEADKLIEDEFEKIPSLLRKEKVNIGYLKHETWLFSFASEAAYRFVDRYIAYDNPFQDEDSRTPPPLVCLATAYHFFVTHILNDIGEFEWGNMLNTTMGGGPFEMELEELKEIVGKNFLFGRKKIPEIWLLQPLEASSAKRNAEQSMEFFVQLHAASGFEVRVFVDKCPPSAPMRQIVGIE